MSIELLNLCAGVDNNRQFKNPWFCWEPDTLNRPKQPFCPEICIPLHIVRLEGNDRLTLIVKAFMFFVVLSQHINYLERKFTYFPLWLRKQQPVIGGRTSKKHSKPKLGQSNLYNFVVPEKIAETIFTTPKLCTAIGQTICFIKSMYV